MQSSHENNKKINYNKIVNLYYLSFPYICGLFDTWHFKPITKLLGGICPNSRSGGEGHPPIPTSVDPDGDIFFSSPAESQQAAAASMVLQIKLCLLI